MPTTTSIIETGVDRLVKLVKQSGKIPMPEAAKQLGVSNTVIEDWADFLEEEGVISIEHSLTKRYLVERKLTKKEVESKAKEFEERKDIFIRKAEGTISSLEREAKNIKNVKSEFDKLRKELGFDFSEVKKELDDLHRFGQLKVNLDKKVQERKILARDNINELSQRISKEHEKYRHLLNEIKDEEEELNKEKEDILSMEESEKLLKKRLDKIELTINRLGQKIGAEDEIIRNSEVHIDKLKNLTGQIRIRAEKEKNMIEPLIEKSRKHEENMLKLQDKIIQKISEKEEKLEKVKIVSSKFKKFFNNKMKVLNLIDKLNQDRDVLENELISLVNKAKSFQLTSKSVEIGKRMLDLERKFGDVDKKKKIFEEEYKKLEKHLKT